MTDPLMRPEDFATGFAQAVSGPVAKVKPMIVKPAAAPVGADSAVSVTVPQVYWETDAPPGWALRICKNPLPNVLHDALLQFEWGGRYHGTSVFKETMMFSVSFNGDRRMSFCEALAEGDLVMLYGDVDHDYYLRMGANAWTINRDDKRKKRQNRDQVGASLGGFYLLQGDLERLRAKVELLKAAW